MGDVVLINDNSPHEVTYVFRFKVPMKHSPDKIIMEAVEFSTGRIFKKTCNLHLAFVVPEVKESEYQLQALDDEKFMALLSSDGQIRNDIQLGSNCDPSLKIEEMLKETEGAHCYYSYLMTIASKTPKAVFLKIKTAMDKERIVSAKIDDI